MLDFLLVLGQVPGTNFQITYNELVTTFTVCSAVYEYRLRQKAIHRWCKWAWYRACVNYRRYRRMARTYIKQRRYRLAVFERRLTRQTRSFIRHKRHDLFMFIFYRRYSSLKRRYYIKLVQMGRLERRAKQTRAFHNLVNLKNLVRRPV
jgi:hypothetical protein